MAVTHRHVRSHPSINLTAPWSNVYKCVITNLILTGPLDPMFVYYLTSPSMNSWNSQQHHNDYCGNIKEGRIEEWKRKGQTLEGRMNEGMNNEYNLRTLYIFHLLRTMFAIRQNVQCKEASYSMWRNVHLLCFLQYVTLFIKSYAYF